jgi:hypothetical protein
MSLIGRIPHQVRAVRYARASESCFGARHDGWEQAKKRRYFYVSAKTSGSTRNS